MADKLLGLTVRASLVIDGVEFQITDARIVYSSSNVPVAEVALAMGYPLLSKVLPQVTTDQRKQLAQGKLATIVVETTGSDVRGKVNGVIFKGYIVDVGPYVSSDGVRTIGYGVQLQHSGILDLDTGTIIDFNTMYSADGFSGQAPMQNDNGQFYYAGAEVNAAELSQSGVWNIVRTVLSTRMQYLANRLGGGGGNLGWLQGCKIIADVNKTAIAALAAVGGSKLEIEQTDSGALPFVLYINNRVYSDLYTMSVAEVIDTFAQDLMFRVIPRANGSVEVQPFTVFSEPVITLPGEEVMNFQPSFRLNRRLGGVVLTPNQNVTEAQRYNAKDAATNFGCYVFDDSHGVIQPVPMPWWLTQYLSSSSNSKLDTAQRPIAAMQAVTSKEFGTAGSEQVTKNELARFGDQVARETAFKLRYQGSSGSFKSYFRGDIGLLSTVRVNSRLTLTDEIPVYGRVDSITLSISSETGVAEAQYNLVYTRPQEVQDALLVAGSKHPFFTDTWAGGPLV